MEHFISSNMIKIWSMDRIEISGGRAYEISTAIVHRFFQDKKINIEKNIINITTDLFQLNSLSDFK